MKLINFIGIERADFAYYVAKILKNENKTILVIDNSVTGDLFQSVTANDDTNQERIVEMENMVYARHVNYNLETYEKFDYVICYTGAGEIDDNVIESDITYAMPDYTIHSLKKVNEQLKQIAKSEHVPMLCGIVRDLVNEKITDHAVAKYIELEPERIAGHITLEPTDMAKYIAFNYNGRQNVNGLSKDYLDALMYVVTQITCENEKHVRKIMKKA